MAGTKTSALTALTTVADGDLLPIVDVSDPTQAPSGSTKRITAENLAAYVVGNGLPFFVADSALVTLESIYALAAAAGGGTVIAKGTFTLLSPLEIPSNTTSDWSAATLRRGWSETVPVAQATKYTGALIRQAGTSAENIKIEGGFIDSNGFDGPLLAFYGVDNLTLSDIDIDFTGAGDWCVTVSGNRINVSNVNPRGGVDVFEDGIHVLGPSDGVTVNGCHIESGDDMVAVTAYGSVSVNNVTVTGITGSSESGFLFKVALDASTTGTIQHVSLAAGAAATGNIRSGGIFVDGVTGDRTQLQHVTIAGAQLHPPAAGSTATVNPWGVFVRHANEIDIVGVQAHDFIQEQLYVIDCDNVRVNGGSYTGPASGAGYSPCRVVDCGRVELRSTFRLGAAATATGVVRLSNNDYVKVASQILAVQNGGQAIYGENGNDVVHIEGCTGTVASGAAHGLRIAAAGGVVRLVYGLNDFEGLGTHGVYPANLPTTMRITPNMGAAHVATLTSDTLDIPVVAHQVQVEGQAGAADNLATMRIASGLNGYTGQRVTLFVGGEVITVKHGTGNIKTITAADVVMTPGGANTVLEFVFDGTNWVQV